MIHTCKFDKNRDIKETVPGLEVSIELALTTGIIQDSCDTTPYNQMTSTDQVGNYLHEPIDIALEARRQGVYMNPASTPSVEDVKPE